MSRFKNLSPGEVVYYAEEEDIIGCLFMAQCDSYVLVCPEYMDCEGDFEDQLALMSSECSEGQCIDVRLIPAKKVFLTPEEAEEYLADKEDDQGKGGEIFDE